MRILAAVFFVLFVPTFSRAATCVDLSRGLSLNSRGPDVSRLQEFLRDNAGYVGQITSNFGPLTEAAVQKFQREKGIVFSGTPGATGYGAVGPKTRAMMACTQAVSAAPLSASTPTIESLKAEVARLTKILATLIAKQTPPAPLAPTSGRGGGGGGGGGGGSTAPPTPSPAPTPPPKLLACGITEARLDEIHTYFDAVYPKLVASASNPANYPQVIYDTQILTASTLQAAEYCKDVYLLDKLATLYAIPFQHMKQDPAGNWVWPDSSGYEQMLASTQWMYAVSRLIRVIVELDLSDATTAMNDFVRSTPIGPRQYLIAHLDRWMNKKSMWIWPECGYTQRSSLREYTFPEYVQKKYERTLGYRAGAPAYCNALNDIDLWAGATAMELVVAESLRHDQIGLSDQLELQLIYFARSVVKLFESRVSVIRSSSPLCGGACDVGGLDIGGWKDHPEHLLPGTETWDISHARRLVQYIDSMYTHADITLPRYTKDYIINLFARALVYLVFNGSFTDPAFSNWLNGNNASYERSNITYKPFRLSNEFPTSGWAFWGPYERDLQKVVDALTDIIDARTPTTYTTPGGEIRGGDYGYMEFYSSLTRPPAR